MCKTHKFSILEPTKMYIHINVYYVYFLEGPNVNTWKKSKNIYPQISAHIHIHIHIHRLLHTYYLHSAKLRLSNGIHIYIYILLYVQIDGLHRYLYIYIYMYIHTYYTCLLGPHGLFLYNTGFGHQGQISLRALPPHGDRSSPIAAPATSASPWNLVYQLQ